MTDCILANTYGSARWNIFSSGLYRIKLQISWININKDYILEVGEMTPNSVIEKVELYPNQLPRFSGRMIKSLAKEYFSCNVPDSAQPFRSGSIGSPPNLLVYSLYGQRPNREDYIVTPIGSLRLNHNAWLDTLAGTGNTKALLSCTDIGSRLKHELFGAGSVDWAKLTPILV